MSPTAPLPVRRSAGRPVRNDRRFHVDSEHSAVHISTRQFGMPLGGSVSVSGSIDMPDDLRSASVTASIVTSGFRATGGRTRRRLAEQLASHASDGVTFTADRMEPILESFVTHDGDRPLWALVGRLTAGGVSRPLRVAVGSMRTTDDGAVLNFAGTTTVSCEDLGIAPRPGASAVLRIRVAGVARRERT